MVGAVRGWWWQLLNPDLDGLHVFQTATSPPSEDAENAKKGMGAMGRKHQAYLREQESEWWDQGGCEEGRREALKPSSSSNCFKVPRSTLVLPPAINVNRCAALHNLDPSTGVLEGYGVQQGPPCLGLL